MVFDINNGVLKKYGGLDEHVVVPEGVSEIGEGAFRWNGRIKSVKLPESLQKINRYAFAMCGKLEKVDIPDGVVAIDECAFDNCNSITEIALPETLKELNGDAFWGCPKINEIRIPKNVESIKLGWCRNYAFEDITSVTVDPENKHFFTINGILYDAAATRMLFIPKDISGEIDLPQGVEVIPEGAFENRNNVNRVNIPRSVKGLGDRAFLKSGITEINLPDSIEKIGKETFARCGKLATIVLPAKVTEIPDAAFLLCDSLESVEAQSVKAVGNRAFERCRNLKSINIGEKVTIGDGAFSGCKGLADSNGFVIINGTLLDYVGSNTRIVVPDGVEIIKRGALYGWANPLVLPSSVKIIEDESINVYQLESIPEGYLQQAVKLPADMTYRLVDNRKLNSGITLKDYAALQLFQSAKKIVDVAKYYTGRNPEDALKAMVELLKEKGKAPHYQKAAEFCLEKRRVISQETINELYDASVATKAKKAIESLAAYADKTENKDDKEKLASCKKAEDSTDETANPIEAFCLDIFTPALFDSFLKKQGVNDNCFTKVKYKDSEDLAPAFVVKCAVVPYMQQLKEVPTHIGSYGGAYSSFGKDPNADRVAATLDPDSFGKMLDTLIGNDMPNAYRTLVPYGRFASGKQISELVSRMNKWKNWNRYSASGRKSIIIARGAILINDSREAMLYADKQGILSTYARIRGMDADIMRDKIMSDFGLDENGKKSFDLGNTTIEVSVNKDLKLYLYDTNAGKEVKSIPKRGAEPEKYERAKAEFADIKKNLKNIVKNRTTLLFNSFLSGQTRKPDSWKSSYLNNYILHKVGELVVWNQKGKTFILTGSGVIDCYGNDYVINDKDPINVAHPMQMNVGEVKAWQKHFTSHGLKQPFEQIWEPVINVETMKSSRYAGRMIPYYRFLKKENHGIRVYDSNFHNEIDISFVDCEAQVERIDWARHQIDMNDRFEVKSIKIKKPTRVANHIIAYLDRVTAIDRIIADDITFADTLHDCSLAQITDYINIANDNGANNVLAMLMDYKNANFADFDPMDEFVLD